MLTQVTASANRAASLRGASALTEQELTVLCLLAADRTYGEIAATCVVSVNTVRTHVQHIYKKLGVRRREQAIAAAQRCGWLGI